MILPLAHSHENRSQVSYVVFSKKRKNRHHLLLMPLQNPLAHPAALSFQWTSHSDERCRPLGEGLCRKPDSHIHILRPFSTALLTGKPLDPFFPLRRSLTRAGIVSFVNVYESTFTSPNIVRGPNGLRIE